MRAWHRRLGAVVGLFMAFIAITGAALQLEMMLDGSRQPMPPPPSAGAGAAAGVVDPSAFDESARALFASVLTGVRRHSPQARLMGVDLRFIGTEPVGEVVIADPQMRRIRVDAKSGALLEGSGAGNRDWHGRLLDWHRGAFAGTSGQLVSLACGVVLTFLSISGLVLYIQLYRRRRANRQPALMW